MPIEIRMPELAKDMSEADLVSWLVKPGDPVAVGDLIAEIETDKATVEFESPVAGVIVELRVAEGTTGVKVGDVLAILNERSEALAETETSTEAREVVVEEPAPTPPAPPTQPEPRTIEEFGTDPALPENKVAATALARRLASQGGVDLRALHGSGAGGRIVKSDVEAALSPGATVAAQSEGSEANASEAFVPEGASSVPHSRMRRTIASRLAEAKRTIPHFYLRIECEIDALLILRKQLNARDEGYRLSVNDFVVRATALALAATPDANVSWTEDAMIHHDRIDVSVAVATDGGLVTPIVRDADRKGLAAISLELKDLAERARQRSLQPGEYRGGSICVSNLGMYGVESVYPILNPPQACIIGVGAGERRPVARGDELAVATLMTCTLSADHRAVDGAIGARLLAELKRRLEDPMEMLL